MIQKGGENVLDQAAFILKRNLLDGNLENSTEEQKENDIKILFEAINHIQNLFTIFAEELKISKLDKERKEYFIEEREKLLILLLEIKNQLKSYLHNELFLGGGKRRRKSRKSKKLKKNKKSKRRYIASSIG
jgi:hypothetical protein